MDKKQPSFADDLRVIQSEVAADVGTILELAKIRRQDEVPASPKSTKVQTNSQQAKRESVRSQRGPIPITPEQPQPPPLQNVTTRLSHATNLLLTEAALRQRLSKLVPATRQDILEEAARDWLHKHGYLKSP